MPELVDAKPGHARELAQLIDLAGEGLPKFLWRDMVEGSQTPLEVGEQRAARDTGGFSYTNARICADGEAVLGMLVAYVQPDPYQLDDLDEYPAVVRPLAELEAKAPGSYYLNALATFPDYRGRGIATLLIDDATERARDSGCELISLIVASHNAAAMRLYERLGFAEQSRLPLVPWDGHDHHGDWVLLTRSVEPAYGQ